jgi:aminomethyltransferase
VTLPESAAQLDCTPLHALHVELGARLVPFAGYEMPLHYGSGILWEHRHTRSQAGLFDVSHMGQLRLSGNIEALESLAPIDLSKIRPGQQRYSFLTNAEGGVIDDLMITHAGDHLHLVVNAARRAVDLAHLRTHLPADCIITDLRDRALLALQGPSAALVLARLNDGVSALSFLTTGGFALAGIECFVSRSGYTGEDGFEISLDAAHAESLARTLLQHPEVAPVGLGARDTLRLEAGLCLYGHELDESATAVEAGLGWVIAKTRRDGPKRGGFPGAERVLAELERGAKRRRVGLLPEGKTPVRDGTELWSSQGEPVGRVTSGSFSPTLNRPIAMGYVVTHCAEPGVTLTAQVRDKRVSIEVVPLPFVSHHYHRK